MQEHSTEQALAGLAGQQHGVVSFGQLRCLGFSANGIDRRAASGRLHRLHRGVYAVGHTALTRRSHELGAVFACEPGAALSHRSAGRLWGILRSVPAIEVTCARTRPPDNTILIHCSSLTGEDTTVIDGIPVTTLARTLIDLADVLDDRRLSDAVHEAEVQRLFDLKELESAQERAPGRRGRHRLNRVLATWQPRPLTRSEAERRFLKLCAQHGLPTPATAINIAGYEVDFLFADVGVVVEIDGAAAHHTRRAFEEDRRRDRALAALGLHVVRVTWRDLEHDAAALAHELKAIRDSRMPC